MKYFADTFGKENIVAAHLHRDEETPHIHATLVPIVKGEHKRRKREEQTKKRYRKKPTDTVRLCADDIMTRLKLKSYQDTYAIAMAKYGLQRGIDGSKAWHKSTQQYYDETTKLADSLKVEVVDLQEQKEAAQQELRQAKKEVQTEKLRGAATTAATNIAESVGSLFGSNKVKTLERENRDLHERVSELEEEVRQREQQQAKHMQEITYTYEQRHRKLSEFTDFVKFLRGYLRIDLSCENVRMPQNTAHAFNGHPLTKSQRSKGMTCTMIRDSLFYSAFRYHLF